MPFTNDMGQKNYNYWVFVVVALVIYSKENDIVISKKKKK